MVRHLPLRTPLLAAPFAPAFYWFGAVHAAHCVVAPQHEVVWEYFTSMLLPLQGCDERAHVGPLRMSRRGGLDSRTATTPRRGFLRRSIARSRVPKCSGAAPGPLFARCVEETVARCAEERRRRQGEGAAGVGGGGG